MDGQKSIELDGYKKYKSLIIERWMIKHRYSLISNYFLSGVLIGKKQVYY